MKVMRQGRRNKKEKCQTDVNITEKFKNQTGWKCRLRIALQKYMLIIYGIVTTILVGVKSQLIVNDIITVFKIIKEETVNVVDMIVIFENFHG